MVYYNEFDHKKAAWLRELIKIGVIANGEVDERSISDVRPSDLVGYVQCHFFAGIGIWSYALRLAGWPDDHEVWTFSCPCQPFSAAGKKKGTADRRHLFPEQFRLIKGRRPIVCFGEQVSSPDGLAWLDIVRSDIEGEAYTFGAVDLCAAGAGAPHIRNRTFFMADTGLIQRERNSKARRKTINRAELGGQFIGMGYSNGSRPQGWGIGRDGSSECAVGATSVVSGMANAEDAERGRTGESTDGGRRSSKVGRSGNAVGMGYSESERCGEARQRIGRSEEWVSDAGELRSTPGPVNGFWSDAGWVLCRPERSDGNPSWRPVRRGSFPLAPGTPGRVGRLRGYGDGIVAPVAAQFIKTCIEERRYGCTAAACNTKDLNDRGLNF